MVIRNKDTFVIESLGRHKREVFSEDNSHKVKVVIREIGGKDNSTPKCGLKPDNKKRLRVPPKLIVNLPEKDESSGRLRKRDVVANKAGKAIELAVFVDDVLYLSTKKDSGGSDRDAVKRIEEFVFTYLNAVQLLYQSDR